MLSGLIIKAFSVNDVIQILSSDLMCWNLTLIVPIYNKILLLLKLSHLWNKVEHCSVSFVHLPNPFSLLALSRMAYTFSFAGRI